MRKVFLCAAVVLGVLNFGYGQFNLKSERITVQTYPTVGSAEQFHLKGSEALAFDIPTFIEENGHLDRIVIDGTFRTALLTTKVSFDTNDQLDIEGTFICKEVKSELTPFLGVWGTGSRGQNGVDIQEIIPTTAADIAGITPDENIIEFNGVIINNFPELKKAVLASEIGERVELKLKTGSNLNSEQVVIGSRGVNTITYKYCLEDPDAILSDSDSNNDVIDSHSFNAYPNPTSDKSEVSFESKSQEDVIFTVTSMNGKLIHKEVISNFSRSLSLNYKFKNASDGTYIFGIQQGQNIYKQRVHYVK